MSASQQAGMLRTICARAAPVRFTIPIPVHSRGHRARPNPLRDEAAVQTQPCSASRYRRCNGHSGLRPANHRRFVRTEQRRGYFVEDVSEFRCKPVNTQIKSSNCEDGKGIGAECGAQDAAAGALLLRTALRMRDR